MDYERPPQSGETLIYAAMSRFRARRLARSWDTSNGFLLGDWVKRG